MRKVLGLAVIAAAVALAVIIGQRMSTDAMAVVIGVVVGVAASIPTSLLVVAATRGRRDERSAPHVPAYAPPPPPQIVVVGAGAPTGQAPWATYAQAGPPALMPPASLELGPVRRRYRVVGESDQWLEAEPDESQPLEWR